MTPDGSATTERQPMATKAEYVALANWRTREEAAAMLGVSTGTLYNWERRPDHPWPPAEVPYWHGRSLWTVRTIESVAAKLGREIQPVD